MIQELDRGKKKENSYYKKFLKQRYKKLFFPAQIGHWREGFFFSDIYLVKIQTREHLNMGEFCF